MAAAPPGDRTEPAEIEALSAVHEAMRERAAVLVQHSRGVEVAVLEPGHSIVVGRDAPSSLRLEDRTLSRTHARLSLVGVRLRVEDLGSTNGTWVGGQRVSSIDVAAGVEVKLGAVLVRAHLLSRGDGAALAAGAKAASLSGEELVIGDALRPLFETAARVADSRLSVLLQGETGTGKEVLARYLHEHSPRGKQPFVPVNCGAIPGQLVESTLFGHERGAFTGAVQQHKGVFESAHGGTVFLDEVGELPAQAQAALLLVLENGRLLRVGSSREIAVDVRVIAATHRDLDRMVAEGAFRADLYYRLHGVTLAIPPLRERRDEIVPLVEKLIVRANAQHGREVVAASTEALVALQAHSWPGNVRELKNAVEQAVVIARGPVLMLADLPAHVRAGAADERRPGAPAFASSSEGRGALESEGPGGAAREGVGAGDDGAPVDDSELRARVDRYEAQLIQEALEAVDFRRADAARRLGLPLRTLARRIKLLGIKKPR